MKAKEFFKSNSFKCIIVLLVITLVCGSIIAMCAVLFRVSEDERLTRSLTAIYGSKDAIPEHNKVDVVGADGKKTDTREIKLYYDDARFYDETKLTQEEKDNLSAYTVVIQKVIMDKDNMCLVKAKGKGCGFSGGSVTVWVKFDLSGGSINKIDKVVNVGNETDSSQTLIGQFKEDYFKQYTENGATEVVTGGGYFKTKKMAVTDVGNLEVVSSGATYTSTAMDVAVNGALYYVREQLPLGTLVYTNDKGGEANG